jgi:hypothetical protein
MSKQNHTTRRKKLTAPPLRQQVVRKYSSEDIHRAIFDEEPQAHSLAELKNGIGEYIKARHGCR